MKNKILTFTGDIVAKPRMTQSDKWKQRSVTSRYWAFKTLLTLQAKLQGFTLDNQIKIIISIPMPKSWSKKKRKEMNLKPHQQKPDLSNIIKAIEDILLPKDDSGIYKIIATKHWINDKKGIIVIQNLN